MTERGDAARSNPLGVRLTPSQRRRLVVALGRAEAALVAVARGSEPGPQLRLANEAMDLPEGFPGPVRELVDRLTAEVRALGEGLGLAPLESSRRRHLLSLCTTSAIGLEESGARSLRGYGAVDPKVAELVDPVLARIEEGLYVVAAALGGGSEE